MDEPKLTDSAAMILLWNLGRFLTLYRNKWELEGTPLILPGGGKREDESIEDCALRELKEETGFHISKDRLRLIDCFPTKWTKHMHVFESEAFTQLVSLEKDKFSGYIWMDTKMVPAFRTLMMPGLASLMKKLGYL